MVKEQLVHVDSVLPVVLPHKAKQSVKSHHIVIEVVQHPLFFDLAVWVTCDDQIDSLSIDHTSEKFNPDYRVDHVKRVECDRELGQGSKQIAK